MPHKGLLSSILITRFMVETRINMLLTEDETRKFEVIKEDIGLRTKSEVVRFCINYVFNDAVKLNQDKDNP